MKTQTFANGKHCSQAGFTLLEVLISLALMTTAIVGLSALFVQTSPRIAVNSATDNLLVDLKRARFEMTRTGNAVVIDFTESGYSVNALDIHRSWPNGISATLDSEQDNQIVFSHHAQLVGYKVTISKGGLNAHVNVAPVTGRIAKQ